MNENLNLVEILKDCPRGTKLYSTVYGEVELYEVDIDYNHPIRVLHKLVLDGFTKDGKMFCNYDGECVLFPSKDQRDWSKFKIKKPKFDPKTLQPFDKVLVRDSDETTFVGDLNETRWKCALYSHEIENKYSPCKYVTTDSPYMYCIPYNDDTKHLVGTTDEAPEFYRYWED